MHRWKRRGGSDLVARPVRHLNPLNVRVGGRRTLDAAGDPAGCNPLRYLKLSTLGLQCSCTGPSVPSFPVQAEGPVPSLRSVGRLTRRADFIPTLTAARLQFGRVQTPEIGVTPASCTPESAQPSHGGLPGDAAIRLQPTVLASQRTRRALELGDQDPVTPPPILR
jgi:hypothetical protein